MDDTKAWKLNCRDTERGGAHLCITYSEVVLGITVIDLYLPAVKVVLNGADGIIRLVRNQKICRITIKGLGVFCQPVSKRRYDDEHYRTRVSGFFPKNGSKSYDKWSIRLQILA